MSWCRPVVYKRIHAEPKHRNYSKNEIGYSLNIFPTCPKVRGWVVALKIRDILWLLEQRGTEMMKQSCALPSEPTWQAEQWVKGIKWLMLPNCCFHWQPGLSLLWRELRRCRRFKQKQTCFVIMTRKFLHRHPCVITRMGGWHSPILTLQSVTKVLCKFLFLSFLCLFTQPRVHVHTRARARTHTHTHT